MTGDTLESPSSAEALYLAASPDQVDFARPVMTGDVFAEVEIPGTAGTGLGIVMTHPCSMRVAGGDLGDRLLMARVGASAQISLKKWATGHFKVMPLPGLLSRHHSAFFDDIGLVRSGALALCERVACLTPYGINLLQQRFVWFLTRFLAPTHRLGEASEAVFEEADLCAEWVAALIEAGVDRDEASRLFDDWIRGKDDSGVTRQSLLAKSQHRAGLRREMRNQLQSAPGGGFSGSTSGHSGNSRGRS